MSSHGRKGKGKPGLTLIRGRLFRELTFGSVRLAAAPLNSPPFPVDAVVAEEDTFLVLSADKRVREPAEHPVRLMTRLLDTRPKVPGTVLVREGRPLRFLAVVHDLNLEPSWKAEWVAKALRRILQETDRRKLKSLALPLLGGVHGGLEPERFGLILGETLETSPPSHLRRLWLVVSPGTGRGIMRTLESLLQGP